MRQQAIRVFAIIGATAALTFSTGVGAQLPEKVGDTPVPALAHACQKAWLNV